MKVCISLSPILVIILTLCLILQGWYIICYALGIYDLNLFIAFLSPKADLWLDSHTGKMNIYFYPMQQKPTKCRKYLIQWKYIVEWADKSKITQLEVCNLLFFLQDCTPLSCPVKTKVTGGVIRQHFTLIYRHFSFPPDNDDDMQLPTRASEEFRPFIRRLPEFKFWYSVMKSTLFATFFTLFDCFNIPVFWPILVLYFITLFIITMKRQIKVSLRNMCRKESPLVTTYSTYSVVLKKVYKFPEMF